MPTISIIVALWHRWSRGYSSIWMCQPSAAERLIVTIGTSLLIRGLNLSENRYIFICRSIAHFQKGRSTRAGWSVLIFWQTRPLKSYDVYWYHVNEWVDTKISSRQNYQYLHIAVRSLNHVRKVTSDLHRRKHLHDTWPYGNNKEPHLDHSHDRDRLDYLCRWYS